MMEEEFDFKKVGKRMPYTVPSDFFDKITESTVAEAERRASAKKKLVLIMPWRALSVAASVAVLLTVGYFMYTGSMKEEKVIAKVQNIEKKKTDTITAPEPSLPLVTQDIPQLATVPKEATEPASGESAKQEHKEHKQQPIQAETPETLEELLATISDEELLHLAAIAKSELYAYEQTAE